MPQVSLEHFEISAGSYRVSDKKDQDTRSAIRLEGCDTPGSRLLVESCYVQNPFGFPDGTKRRGLDVDRADHLRVELQSWFVRRIEGHLQRVDEILQQALSRGGGERYGS